MRVSVQSMGTAQMGRAPGGIMNRPFFERFARDTRTHNPDSAMDEAVATGSESTKDSTAFADARADCIAACKGLDPGARPACYTDCPKAGGGGDDTKKPPAMKKCERTGKWIPKSTWTAAKCNPVVDPPPPVKCEKNETLRSGECVCDVNLGCESPCPAPCDEKNGQYRNLKGDCVVVETASGGIEWTCKQGELMNEKGECITPVDPCDEVSVISSVIGTWKWIIVILLAANFLGIIILLYKSRKKDEEDEEEAKGHEDVAEQELTEKEPATQATTAQPKPAAKTARQPKRRTAPATEQPAQTDDPFPKE